MKWLFALAVIWVAWKLLRPAKRLAPPSTSAERDAMGLLGVSPAAEDQAIRDAHRRKVADAHPDRGGSDELTQELNAARDLLLRTR